MDEFLPTVDLGFLRSLIEASPKVEHKVIAGSTVAYVLYGKKPMAKRIFVLRDVGDNCVDFNFSTGIAIRLGFMSPLLEWLEASRNWKDGGYIQP